MMLVGKADYYCFHVIGLFQEWSVSKVDYNFSKRCDATWNLYNHLKSIQLYFWKC
jgi:hypothetical protein